MIILDTHIWIWWTDGNTRLTDNDKALIENTRASGVGISAFSCWEVAKLLEKNRIRFSISLDEWFDKAFSLSGISLLPLSPKIIDESIKLPGSFHNDPADQIIVATARVYDCALVTYDSKILSYKHVKLRP